MIILDTNVLSEIMRAEPHPEVLAWLDQQPTTSIWITAITAFETRYGLAMLPEGKRRKNLEDGYECFIHQILDGRILSLDAAAAEAAGLLAAEHRARGMQIDFRDTLIAGIAISQRATLATRNTKDFQDMTPVVRVVNPWVD